MADIFISYAREDRVRAEQMAHGLEQAGLNPFWDNEIPPGQTWADYIETKLTQCDALIVLWSATSTKSQWVREEARMGRDKGVLIPVMIDSSTAPFGFGEVQAANLSSWTGDYGAPDWQRFVEAVKNVAGAPPRPAPQPGPSSAPPPRIQPVMSAPAAAAPKKGVPTWAWVVGGVVAVIAALALLGSLVPDQPTTQTAAVTPALPAQQAPSTAPVDTSNVPAQAGGNYQQQILTRLQQVEQSFAAQGFRQIAQPVTGQLAQGQTQNWPVNLQGAGDYRVIGVCDDDCGDLDLVLTDQGGNIVSQDQSTDPTPIVAATIPQPGAFTVQANMYNCRVAPCYYALALFGRPLQ